MSIPWQALIERSQAPEPARPAGAGGYAGGALAPLLEAAIRRSVWLADFSRAWALRR